jgi:hypothetical protein
VIATLNDLLVLAQESPGPGRSSNPDDGGGIAIVIGIALAVLVVLAVVGLLVRSRMASRRSNVPDREPHERGRVGRIR